MRQIISQLEGLRRRSRFMLLTQRVSVLLAWTVGVIVALIAFDYALRLPATFRLVLLLLGLGAFVAAVWQYLLIAFRFAPSLTQIALRLERFLPNVSGRLASSVEFSLSGVDRDNPLAARSVHDTEMLLAGGSFREAINPKRTLRDIAIMLGVVIMSLTFALTNPATAQTGLARLFIPFGDVAWPARTGVESLMHEVIRGGGVHPRGQALKLRAQVTRGPEDQRITARYRLMDGGQFGQWQQAVLTRQGQTAVHERLIESSAERIELSFHTADDATDREHVDIVPPPDVSRAALVVEPPAYARQWVGKYEQEMGPGIDNRAVTDVPSLVGSTIELRLTLNKPLPVPADDANDENWLRTTLGWGDSPLPAFAIDSEDAAIWRVRWLLEQTQTISLDLVDEYNLRNPESITYRINAVEDQPPTVTITTPESDRTVLRTALVPLTADAQDDVALHELSLRADRRPGNDMDAELIRLWTQNEAVNASSGTLNTQFDLNKHDIEVGDHLIITATATDHYATNDEPREPVVSSPRRLRVIDEIEFASQLRRELSNVRRDAIRIESAQHDLQESIIEDGPQPGSERSQAQIADRIAAQQEAIDGIAEQMRMNRLDDAQLESLLDQSQDMLDFAGRAAERAADAIAERRERQRAERNRDDAEDDPDDRAPGEPAEADREITQAQQEVRDELEDLIALLDRDEDTWVVTRKLESLREEQRQLERQTEELSRRTLGQSLEDLPEADLSELDRIAQRQRVLRDEARQLLEDLRRRAEAMQEIDPQSSSGMRTAAETGEQRELDREMDQAADQVDQNRLRNAQAGQQGAAETLDRMLRDIEDSQRARAQELLRRLASLIESIERLIHVQENEIAALARAENTDDYSGRDRAMIRLNQNTQSVAGEARNAGQEVRRIARLLDRASDAQGAAIIALRTDPIEHVNAFEAEEHSLELLREAHELAEQLQEETQDAETRRQRQELIEAYRELAERQIALREDTVELKGIEELDRRQLIESRRLGTAQHELRNDLADLKTRVRELAESTVFKHVHRRLDSWLSEVSDRLLDGDVTITVTDRQLQIAQSIGRLIEALEETMVPPDDFDADSGGDGGGQQAQPLIPPVAELRLLRGIQEEIYNHTRRLDTRDDMDDAQRRLRLREIGREQRELREIGQELLDQLQQR